MRYNENETLRTAFDSEALLFISSAVIVPIKKIISVSLFPEKKKKEAKGLLLSVQIAQASLFPSFQWKLSEKCQNNMQTKKSGMPSKKAESLGQDDLEEILPILSTS